MPATPVNSAHSSHSWDRCHSQPDKPIKDAEQPAAHQRDGSQRGPRQPRGRECEECAVGPGEWGGFQGRPGAGGPSSPRTGGCRAPLPGVRLPPPPRLKAGGGAARGHPGVGSVGGRVPCGRGWDRPAPRGGCSSCPCSEAGLRVGVPGVAPGWLLGSRKWGLMVPEEEKAGFGSQRSPRPAV